MNYLKTFGFVQPSYVVRKVFEIICYTSIRTLSLSSKRQFLDAQQINNPATYCRSPVHEASLILITLLSFSAPPSCGVLRVWSTLSNCGTQGFELRTDIVNVKDALVYVRGFGLEMVSVVSPQIVSRMRLIASIFVGLT